MHPCRARFYPAPGESALFLFSSPALDHLEALPARGGSISFYMIDDLGMEKRPRRFSLPEAFFEGTAPSLLAEAKGMDEEVRRRLSGRREASKTPWRSHGDCFVTSFLAMTVSALGETSGLTIPCPEPF